MAGKNQRSATLPSSLRHGIQHTEESEGFFTKLKKKFKLKKGRYHVDVNTGECQNVSAVSFRKRESREVSDDESPWQLRDQKSEERELKSNSTKLSKLPHGKQTDKISSCGKERKLSNPETYTRSLNSSEISSFQRNSFGAKPKSTNEYSPLTYDTKENVAERSLKLRESALKNEFIVHDDSAIELDPDVEAVNKVSETDNEMIDIEFDPGYEKLPERRGNTNKSSEVSKPEFDPKYESVKEAHEKMKCESEFDPNYESVDEVKSRMLKLSDQDDDFSIDPGYQSVKDVKREMPDRTTRELIRPAKTYSLNQSIESLDEPGYESLNDVKKRIKDQSIDNADKRTSAKIDHISESTDISLNFTEDEYLDDSAIGSVSKYGCSPHNDLLRNRSLSGDGSVTSDSNGGLRAFAETAVSLTGIATAVTGSGTSKDNGFKSKELSSDPVHEDNLYSSVKKVGKTHSENPYSMVKKDRKQSDGGQLKIAPASDKTRDAPVAPEPGLDDYDSDTGVMLDPGYAECADAIKGIIPYSIYSEGSGSKMSSCTSLDLSAEDFALEPGYAECADAIKSGAIKKISVSHERLVDHSVGTKNEDIKAKGEISSEIYANPQILFRKRSKLIEDGNLEDLRETSEKIVAIDDKSASPEKEICLAVEKKGKKKERNSKNIKETKVVPLEAPPLPARNYSLYLENEEAEVVVQEVLQDCARDETIDESSLDEAFETEESGIIVKEDALTKPDTEKNFDAFNQTEEEKADISIGLLEINSKLQGGSGCEVAKPDNGSISNVDTIETNDKSAHSDEKEAVDETSESVKGNQDNSSDLNSNENKTKEGGNEQVHKGNSAKCSEMCITNTEESDLTEKYKCDRKKYHDCSDKTNKLIQEVTVAQNDVPSLENFLQVNVKDASGNVKILNIIEKEESPTLQKKRENSRKKSGHCLEGNSIEKNHKGDATCNECNKLAVDFCAKSYLSHTKDLSDSESVSQNSTNSNETKSTCIAYHVNQRSTSSKSVIQDSCEKSDSTVMEPQLMLAVQSCKDDVKTIVSGHVNTYQANPCNYINGLSEVDSNNFLTVAVKMKNISVDSDSDFFNTEDLPKLEINESDLESPFDSSDNSNNLDIETESAGIDKLTQRLNAEDIPEVCSEQTKPQFNFISSKSENTCSECEVNKIVEENDAECDKCGSYNDNGKEVSLNNDAQSERNEGEVIQLDKESSLPVEEKLCSNKTDLIQDNYVLKATYEVPEVSEGLSEDKTNDKNATLESKLCVIEPEKGGETDISKLMRGNSDDTNAETDSADTELSDDSAIGNINDLQQNIDFLRSDIDGALSCSNNVENVPDIELNKEVESNISENVTSQDLHLIYIKEHPSLYEDSEPTHMSLQEVMGLSPAHDQVTVTQSDSSGQSVLSVTSPNTFLTHIPNDDGESTVTPPPRPPPVALGRQPRNMFSLSSTSSQNTAILTPTDEVPPPLRLSYTGGLSDEGSPPAIPPRLKSVRGTKRPVSYSQDFMESMRQLKDCGWYWGPLSWEEAEHKLAKKPEGTFLVRDSSDEHYILSLSFKNQGRVHHTRIEHHKGHFSFWSQPDSHGKSTIKEFIEQCVENSRNGRFLYFIRPSGPGSPPMPIQLLNPVSRFVQMRSLQHMCRFRILQLVRRDHIDHLPVPTRIKQYLKEAQYYVEYLDD